MESSFPSHPPADALIKRLKISFATALQPDIFKDGQTRKETGDLHGSGNPSMRDLMRVEMGNLLFFKKDLARL